MSHAPDPDTIDQVIGLAQFAIYIALTLAALWLITKIFPSIGRVVSALLDDSCGPVEKPAEIRPSQHAFHRPEKTYVHTDRWL
jgi:hypothetical protein